MCGGMGTSGTCAKFLFGEGSTDCEKVDFDEKEMQNIHDELNTSEKEPLATHASYLTNRMKSLGVLMSTDGPDYNVLKIKPPMVFSKENAKELIFRLHGVFQEDFMSHY